MTQTVYHLAFHEIPVLVFGPVVSITNRSEPFMPLSGSCYDPCTKHQIQQTIFAWGKNRQAQSRSLKPKCKKEICEFCTSGNDQSFTILTFWKQRIGTQNVKGIRNTSDSAFLGQHSK